MLEANPSGLDDRMGTILLEIHPGTRGICVKDLTNITVREALVELLHRERLPLAFGEHELRVPYEYTVNLTGRSHGERHRFTDLSGCPDVRNGRADELARWLLHSVVIDTFGMPGYTLENLPRHPAT